MTIRDGDWTLLEWDPVTGRTVWTLFDGEKTVIRTDYPVSSIMEHNAAVRNATPDGWQGDYHRIASVPLNLLHDENTGLMKAHKEGDDAYVSRWLNDIDNRAWRTKDGRV